MFLNQVILRGGLPFDVRLPAPNETTRQAMREAEEGVSLHRFESAEDMFKELGIE
jgi:addiction module RelB/DinJ family antitoxin